MRGAGRGEEREWQDAGRQVGRVGKVRERGAELADKNKLLPDTRKANGHSKS